MLLTWSIKNTPLPPTFPMSSVRLYNTQHLQRFHLRPLSAPHHSKQTDRRNKTFGTFRLQQTRSERLRNKAFTALCFVSSSKWAPQTILRYLHWHPLWNVDELRGRLCDVAGFCFFFQAVKGKCTETKVPFLVSLLAYRERIMQMLAFNSKCCLCWKLWGKKQTNVELTFPPECKDIPIFFSTPEWYPAVPKKRNACIFFFLALKGACNKYKHTMQ